MDDINAKLDETPYKLLIQLSEELSGERVVVPGMGLLEHSQMQEARMLSRYWIEDWFTVFRDIVCVKGELCGKIKKVYNDDKFQIAIALADILAPQIGVPSAATISALIVKYGASRFCGCSQESSTAAKEDFLSFLPSGQITTDTARVNALCRVAALHVNAQRIDLALPRIEMAQGVLENGILHNGKIPIGTKEGDLINLIGYEYLECGKPDDALSILLKASSVMQNNVAFLDTLGWAYFHHGDHHKAVKHLQEACTLDDRWTLGDGSFEIRFHLLNALMKDKKRGQAKEILEELKRENKANWVPKALKLFPELR
jgi:tetratricopeptide (TPR) repeat protein